jgi:hypothetical protein
MIAALPLDVKKNKIGRFEKVNAVIWVHARLVADGAKA